MPNSALLVGWFQVLFDRMSDELARFEAENAAFESRKEELLKLCEGKFAVFKGEEFLGVFDSPQAAYAAGIEKYGNVSFLIKHVTSRERVEQVPALYLGLLNAHT